METATYRLLQPTGNLPYSHAVIARQFISSNPPTPYAQTLATVTINFCLGGSQPYECFDYFACPRFQESYTVNSLMGFNERFTSTLSWDSNSADKLRLNSVLPENANNVTNLSTSSSRSESVSWSIAATAAFQNGKPNIGINPKAGQSLTWSWSQAQSISIPDWSTLNSGQPQSPTVVLAFFASGGPNSFANLQTYANAPGDGTLSFDKNTGLTTLQKGFLTYRNETNWTTSFSNTLLPVSPKPILTASLGVNYGDVYGRYTLETDNRGYHEGVQPYGFLHTFGLNVPIELDFSGGGLQPPLPAPWDISVELVPGGLVNGFFRVEGAVALN